MDVRRLMGIPEPAKTIKSNNNEKTISKSASPEKGEDAKKLGQRLVVAVNSDASVKRLKGEGRPIQSAESRMAVLAGLEAVDWVVVFGDDTPERLLEILKPDVLVKGGDYTPAQVVGAPIVQAYGGEVAVLSFVDQCSTTSIVKTILSRHAS